MLIACVPNFSEGHSVEIIDAIRESIQEVPSVSVLNQHTDPDHNRTVITFIGDVSSVEKAAYQMIATAAGLIDLNQHKGVHPRIGATDVVPLIPLHQCTMETCVNLARRLGERVGRELQIPVYLYEKAALRSDRQQLEVIRRGQYEKLKIEIETDPERQPDYGPNVLGSAGATVIGARDFLVAYNIFLTTDDVQIAKNIARRIRSSSGGFRYVKALGFFVQGRAQVSINFTNFEKTAIFRVVEFVRREATRYGVNIHHTELVGLIPTMALIQAAEWYLQLDGFNANRLVESHIQAFMNKD